MSQASAQICSSPSLRRRIDNALTDNLLEYPHTNPEILKAALYSVQSGGHRWRPVLLLSVFQILVHSNQLDSILGLACAVEYLHTASIILDDLPGMDDATLRRGQNTCHRQFSQGVAILTACWFCDVSQHLIHEFQKDNLVNCGSDLESLFRATKNEMISGQTQDLRSEALSEHEIIEKSRQKSGALYGLTASLPAHILGLTDLAKHLDRFGNFLGLAYQISDDMHDLEGTTEASGKDVRKDEARSTIPRLYGLTRAGELRDAYLSRCREELSATGYAADDIMELVEMICA